MLVQIKADVETRLSELVASSGRPADEYVEDALTNYFDDLAEVRDLLATRYEEVKAGKVTLVDGEAFFASLLEREEGLA